MTDKHGDMDGHDYRMMRINNVDSRDDRDRSYKCDKFRHYTRDCRQHDPVNAVGEKKSCSSQTDTESDSNTEPECVSNNPGIMAFQEFGTTGRSRASQREYFMYYH